LPNHPITSATVGLCSRSSFPCKRRSRPPFHLPTRRCPFRCASEPSNEPTDHGPPRPTRQCGPRTAWSTSGRGQTFSVTRCFPPDPPGRGVPCHRLRPRAPRPFCRRRARCQKIASASLFAHAVVPERARTYPRLSPPPRPSRGSSMAPATARAPFSTPPTQAPKLQPHRSRPEPSRAGQG